MIHHFISGKKTRGTGNSYLDNVYPATGQPIGQIPMAGDDDVEQAISAAKNAGIEWSSLTGAERGRILMKAAELLRKRNRELAELEVRDTGKPISEALAVDIHSGADALEYFGGLAASVHGEHLQLGKSFAYTRREPYGVCAGIGAWNYPMQIACWKAAPALACGNTMVFKPAELTPTNAVNLAKIFIEAGMPPGVFNVIQGAAQVGKKLVTHPEVRKVSITGEVGTGKKVMADAAPSLKAVSLELGGKNPLIIFDDATLEEAVQGAMLANFYTQGEVCSNGTRVYVHKQIIDRFLELLKEETETLKIGDPMDKTTRIGALISKDHRDKVLSYLEIGRDEGAELLFGGEKPEFTEDSSLQGGYFLTPAVFLSDSDNHRISKEEIFGPVMTVLPFETEEEVISRANNTPYGLSAGVFTSELSRAHRVVSRLEAGVCWINNYNITPVEIPFGGYKQSGIGRENGRAAIEHYTQLKTVYVEMEGVGKPFE